MVEKFNTSQPIYYQIIQKLCRQIVRGDIKAGEKLPSVRDMAVQTGVNPNTVQRTYSELERLKLAETRRGLGTFITEEKERLHRLREQLKAERIAAFIDEMLEMGFSNEDIINGITNYLKNEVSQND